MMHRKLNGFTLIEILIAMAIIGILSGVGFASFSGSMMRSRDAQRKSGLSQLQRALENYLTDNGSYPQASVDHHLYDQNGDGGIYPWGSPFEYTVRGTEIQYMKTLPKDPLKDRTFQYYVSDDFKKYVIYGALENFSDQAVIVELGVTCGTIECNYAAMSSNLATPSALNQ